MDVRARWRKLVVVVAAAALLMVVAPSAGASDGDFASPLFGLTTAPNGSILVADAGSGIWQISGASKTLVTPLPGVVDVKAIGSGQGVALTTTGGDPDDPVSTPGGRQLLRISKGNTRMIADVGAFELANDPDGRGYDSNPFDLAVANGGEFLVIDSGGNSLLRVDNRGNIELVAVFPQLLVPDPFAPGDVLADPVPTSVEIGPDGAYYVGELIGFPATPGASRVWRIEAGTTNADCATSEACSVVGTGFTSIIDLAFDGDILYVLELDEATWFAVEVTMTPEGGTLNRCTLDGTLTCTEAATDLSIPTAVTIRRGTPWVTLNALIPGAATVQPIS